MAGPWSGEQSGGAVCAAVGWLYGYDGLGQVTHGSKYWGDGTSVAGERFQYAFDTIGNRTGTTACGYDNASRVKTAGDGADLATSTYLANSPLLSHVVHARGGTNRMTTTRQYDYFHPVRYSHRTRFERRRPRLGASGVAFSAKLSHGVNANYGYAWDCRKSGSVGAAMFDQPQQKGDLLRLFTSPFDFHARSFAKCVEGREAGKIYATVLWGYAWTRDKTPTGKGPLAY